jgi:LmbE family N-acetylglucosaminyl deacetylase
MKFLEFDHVLCLNPHPDDVEYAMACTIAKHYSTEFDIFYLSLGTSTDVTSGSGRTDETYAFWDHYGLDNVSVKRLTSQIKAFEELNKAEWVTCMEKDISKYDAIFGPSPHDSHQEHMFVGGLMPALTRNEPISIIEYKTPSTLYGWEPNCFISITGAACMFKNTALRKFFISQADARYFNKDCISNFHTDFLLSKRGVKFSEQFKIKTYYKE